MKMSEFYSVGVVGFSKQNFDADEAKLLIINAFDRIETFASRPINCISGWTNQGIPALAYAEATERGWKTTGVACGKIKKKNYDLFDVNFSFIEGEQWGDESELFLSMLDAIVKIGGGDQSEKELKMAQEQGITVLEYELTENQESQED